MAGGLEGFSFEQRHGKDRVRVARVCRAGGGRHFMVEWDVSISLFSDIVGAYARGNNSGIVATDTMKNTTGVRSFDCPTNCIIPSLNVSAGLLGFFFVKTWTKVREKSAMLKVPSRDKRNLDLVASSGLASSGSYLLAMSQNLADSSQEYEKLSLA